MSDSSAAGGSARRAILFVLGSSGLFTVASALVKVASPEIPIAELMLFRCLIAFICMMPLIPRMGGWAALRPRSPWGHMVRAMTGLAGMFGSFYGFAHLPIAAATALGFAMPIFLALLSVPLLHERLTPVRVQTIVAGLVGVLLVVRPWEGSMGLPLFDVAVVLGGVAAWAASMATIRRMGQSGERNVTIVLLFTAAGTVVCAVLAAPVWVWPRIGLWPALLGIGAVSAAAQLLMTEGYRSGEASLLAPFEYSAIFYTVTMGWLFWAETPGPWEATGISILVLSGLLTWWREGRRA